MVLTASIGGCLEACNALNRPYEGRGSRREWRWCVLGCNPVHHTNQMDKLLAIAAVAALSINAAAPAKADQAANQEWCETNLEFAIDLFNKHANNQLSRIATLTSPVRATNVHRDAFWAGGEYITGCQFNFRTTGNHHAVGRFNVERLSSGKIMVGTAAWSAH